MELRGDLSSVAFLAYGSAGEKGIYANIGGTLVDVVNVEDTIGGKLIADLDFGPLGFSETGGIPQVTYRASFSDSGSDIFTVNVPPPVPGDYNGNGAVNAADYVVWRKGLGTIYTQNDYNVWRTNFGQPGGSGSVASANAAVPEPATLMLLMFAAAGWCLRRSRSA